MLRKVMVEVVFVQVFCLRRGFNLGCHLGGFCLSLCNSCLSCLYLSLSFSLSVLMNRHIDVFEERYII